MDQTTDKNNDLRQLAVRLATIIRDGVVERRLLAATRGSDFAPCLLAAVTPARSVDRLREVAMLCSQLSRDDRDSPTARTLEDLGVELAVEASGLAALLKRPPTDQQPIEWGFEHTSGTPAVHSLTLREVEVLTWIARGKSARQIGRILGISKRTVDAHALSATRKLGAANRTEASVIALRRHIIALESRPGASRRR